MKNNNISLAIIEDDKVVLQGLQLFFENQEEFNKVIAVESVETFLDILKSDNKIDIVLTDIGLPGISGIEGMRLVKNQIPDVDIIMLTVFKDSDRIFKSLCAGAAGYLLKGTPFDEIKQSVFTILQGGSYMSPEIARKVMTHFAPKKRNESDTLTPKEEQIVQCLVDGLSYKLIADRLTISIDTVRYHIKNIYTKLQVNSKSEVISKSLRGEI